MNEDITFFATRYALGRRTGAVGMVVDYLKKHWTEISERTQEQIQKEIKEAIRTERAGMDCDIENWKEILELK